MTSYPTCSSTFYAVPSLGGSLKQPLSLVHGILSVMPNPLLARNYMLVFLREFTMLHGYARALEFGDTPDYRIS